MRDKLYHYLRSGPQPLEILTAPPDYEHYINKQLMPIADAILPFLEDDFTTFVNRAIIDAILICHFTGDDADLMD